MYWAQGLFCRKLGGHRLQKPPSFAPGASDAIELGSDGLDQLVALCTPVRPPISLGSLDLDERLMAGLQGLHFALQVRRPRLGRAAAWGESVAPPESAHAAFRPRCPRPASG